MGVEFVAEMTTNHLGNLNLARRMIDEAARVGADAVKFQKKTVDAFYTAEKLAAEFESPYGHTFGDYRRVFEFEKQEEWQSLCELAEACNVRLFATAQDQGAFTDLIAAGVVGWRVKIASCNARDRAFLRYVAATVTAGVEIVISVAGLTLDEVEAAVRIVNNGWRRVWVLHCVAEYPCPAERLRLGNIPELIGRFQSDRVRIGYSGHEVGWRASVAAAALGAEMIERHFCLSRSSFAHHIECSLMPSEFWAMRRAIETGAKHGMPVAAFTTSFGMTDTERDFLERGRYATSRLDRGDGDGEGVKRDHGSGLLRAREIGI